MSIEAMVAASTKGKITDFEQAFQSEISQRVAERIQTVKQELGNQMKGASQED